MFKLRCPDCYGKVSCEPAIYFNPSNYCSCGRGWDLYQTSFDLVPEWAKEDSGYQFEMGRYDSIASTDPKTYHGYYDTKPLERARLMKTLIGDKKEVVELGPGFGELLKILEVPSLAIEQSQWFLNYLKGMNLGTILVKGIAEDLPLETESVECFVADSVFQSIINREEFLYELSRVCGKDALIILTIAHKWNYPRRPQNGFNIKREDEFEVLQRFLDELGFDCEYKWYSLDCNAFYQTSNNIFEPLSDYLYIIGTK